MCVCVCRYFLSFPPFINSNVLPENRIEIWNSRRTPSSPSSPFCLPRVACLEGLCAVAGSPCLPMNGALVVRCVDLLRVVSSPAAAGESEMCQGDSVARRDGSYGQNPEWKQPIPFRSWSQCKSTGGWKWRQDLRHRIEAAKKGDIASESRSSSRQALVPKFHTERRI